MTKLDLKTTYKHLYQPSLKEFSLVDVPPFNYLMVDGHGDPNHAPEYQQAVELLYGMAYTIKFALKPQLDFTVMPLEGLWWVPDMRSFSQAHKDDWDWTMMILQPELVTPELVAKTRQEVTDKKKLPGAVQVRLETFTEGLSAQILYLGAYADEGPTIARIHAWIAENGYQPAGKHHEIYLGDPRRNPPEKLKTIIRQPVQPV